MSKAKSETRTEEQIRKELDKARADYHGKASEMTPRQTTSATKKITELHKELSSLLSKGAHKCPDCKSEPVGMKKRESFNDKNLGLIPALYEVGCPVCGLYQKDGQQIYHAARGGSPEEAVKKWNNGDWATL